MSFALKWHRGCQKDRFRNDFIIPSVLTVMSRLSPKNLSFLGSGTGYIPHEISKLTASDIEFSLFDLSVERLEFSKKLDFSNRAVFFLNQDFTLIDNSPKSELVVIANTLLEIPLNHVLVRGIVSKLTTGGTILVFMPNVLEDVLNVHDRSKKDIITEYLSGSTTLTKVDSFTELEYPFTAYRTTTIISHFLAAGLSLVKIEVAKDCRFEVMMEFRLP